MLLFLTSLVIRFQIGKARLLSLTLPQSDAWLSAPPIPSLGLHLQPNEFRAALKYRIGVPLNIEERRKCPYCQNGRLDKLGDQALNCHGRGDMISRHDRVRDIIFAACSTANLSPVCEQKNLIPDNNSRPGDILAQLFSGTTISVRRNHNFPTAAQSKFRGGEVWFFANKC